MALLRTCSGLLAGVLLAGLLEGQADPATPAPDEGLASITFKDIRWSRRSLGGWAGAPAVVIIFLDRHCPLAARYVATLNALQDSFGARGARFIVLDSHPGDSMVELASWSLETGLRLPVFKDFDQSAMRAMAATRTPEALVLDRRLCIRYRGAIDDQFTSAGSRPAPARTPVRDAVEALLESRNPPVSSMPVDGCLITAHRPPRKPGVTWSGEVEPIFRRHCVRCHAPPPARAFPLQTVNQVRDRAEMIREVVAERRMPPVFHDPGHGGFTSPAPPPQDDVDSILAWIDGGMDEGGRGAPEQGPEPGTEPPAGPDLLLAMPEPFRLPPSGYVDYHYVTLEPPFAEETWVSAIEVLPGNHRVVHHVVVDQLLPPEKGSLVPFVTGYLPGGEMLRLPAGTALRIHKGARLRLQFHYVTNGREETDLTRVAITYARGPVTKELRTLIIWEKGFLIPPFEPAFEVRACGTISRSSLGLMLLPHMHRRGRDMTVVAHAPGTAPEILLRVPTYSFDWQLGYSWGAGGRRIPPGTVLETIAHFDNSRDNLLNPDPAQAVGHGQETLREMDYLFLFYVHEDENLGISVDPRTGWRVAAPEGPR